MGFLGGFLKFLAITLLIIATGLCTAVAVMNGLAEFVVIMALVWLVCLLVILNIWGTGMALSEVNKLKKKVQELERGSKRLTEEEAVIEAAASELPHYKGRYNSGGSYQSKSGSGKKVLIAVLILVILVVLALAAVLVMNLIDRNSAPIVYQEAPGIVYYPEETFPVEAPAVPEVAPSGGATAALGMGETVEVDFMQMAFEDYVVASDIKHSVTVGMVTRHTGPDPLPGQQYICLEGVIQNTSTSPLPVYDFFLGEFDIDGYKYKVGATDCDILTPDGDTVTNIDPLMEYKFRIYTAIPDQLANSFSQASFRFGFYDGFDNRELSSSRAFSEDPVGDCPYQFDIAIR